MTVTLSDVTASNRTELPWLFTHLIAEAQLPDDLSSIGAVVSPFDCVQLFATPWTVAQWAPLLMGLPRQEYGSGLPFPSPGDLPTQGLNPGLLCLLHCRQTLHQLSHGGRAGVRIEAVCPAPFECDSGGTLALCPLPSGPSIFISLVPSD